jgi:hypothetical protein
VRCIDAKTGWLVAVLLWLAGCASPLPPPSPPRPGVTPAPSVTGRLPAPGSVRSWDELRLQAARRLVAANPGLTYMDAAPEVLLAIPVLEVELNADGSIRRIEVMRVPRQAQDTVQIAIDAMRRAGPFGDISRLPKPWKFSETFLFNDDRKFKPRTLNP